MEQNWKEFYEMMKTRPKCSVPGCTEYAQNMGNKNGKARWRKNPDDSTHTSYICNSHHVSRLSSNKIYKLYKKNYCENIDGRLGFKCPVKFTKKIRDAMYYHVDHIDGNPSNSDPENLQTLCPICNQIKTRLNKDSQSPGRIKLGIR